MKRLLCAAVALSVLGGGVASAQPYHRTDHRPGYDHDRRDHAAQRRHWARGERLPPAYWTRSHYVDYRSHHLRAPPRGYQWVRADDDYALVAITSGLIAQIVAGR